MIKKKILIFGATGQIGKSLIRKLTKNNYKVVCQTRNIHKAIFLKTSGSIGYIDIQESNIFDIPKITELIMDVDICINLIGILYEKNKNNSFDRIHTDFPDIVSKICKQNSKKFIHLSALAVENIKDSKYAISKFNGENKIKENLIDYVIIKPSIVFSIDDKFTTKFMSMLSLLPFFPLYYNGMTQFQPIHVSDLTDLIYKVIDENISGKEIEAVGPEILTFKKILEILLDCIGKKKPLISMPFFISKISAKIFQLMPNPLLTMDQLKLLKYNNVQSSGGITNSKIGSPSKITFKEGVQKYAYNWMESGQFSLKNLKDKNL